jgi:hypothetical protein
MAVACNRGRDRDFFPDGIDARGGIMRIDRVPCTGPKVPACQDIAGITGWLRIPALASPHEGKIFRCTWRRISFPSGIS